MRGTPLLLGSVLLGAVSTGQAGTVYVGSGGSDHTPCAAVSVSRPRATIAGGLACTRSGDTLQIGSGTYHERIASRQLTSGQGPQNPTVIRAAPGATVVLQPTTGVGPTISVEGTGMHDIVFDGLRLDGSRLAPAQRGQGGQGRLSIGQNGTGIQRITFQNGAVEHMPGTAVFVGNGVSEMRLLHNTIGDTRARGRGQNCDPDDTGCHGLYYAGHRGRIQGNTIHDVSGHGMQIYSAGNHAIRDNLIQGNGLYRIVKSGIVIGASASNTLVQQNLMNQVGQCFNYGGPNTQLVENACANAHRWIGREYGHLVTRGNHFHNVGGALPPGSHVGGTPPPGPLPPAPDDPPGFPLDPDTPPTLPPPPPPGSVPLPPRPPTWRPNPPRHPEPETPGWTDRPPTRPPPFHPGAGPPPLVQWPEGPRVGGG